MIRKSTAIVVGVSALCFFAIVLVVTRKKPPAPPAPPTVAVLGPARTSPQVSIQGQTAFLIAPDGSLWWWGESLPGFGANQLTPKFIGESRDWVRVSVGSRFGVALKRDGSMWSFGQIPIYGTGRNLEIMPSDGRIVEIMPGNKWRQAVAGYMHALAIREDGSLWAWGDNSNGELGIVPTGTAKILHGASGIAFLQSMMIANQVGTDTNWTAVSAGMLTSLAIKSDGSLWHWGAISHVQTGPKTYSTVPQTSPVQLGTNFDWKAFDANSGGIHVLKQDGARWLYTSWPSSPVKLVQLPSPNGDWAAQVGGWPTGWGIKQDRTLWTWNSAGPGAAPSTPKRFDRRSDWQGIWIDSVGQARVGLTADGQLWTWGTTIGAPLQPTTGPNVLIARLVAKVRGNRFDAPMMYPSTREPWLIMRFESNTAAATPTPN